MASRSASINFSWPTDEDGEPMTLITFQMSDLIPTAKYANITVGPAGVTRFVKTSETEKGLQKATEEVENLLANEREKIYDALDIKPS